LYPATIGVLHWVGLDVGTAAIMIAAASGLASVPVFQKIAEHYFDRERALVATLLYFMLPPIFVFSGVSYSEPLFLLFTLLAWRYDLANQSAKSAIAASFSALTKTYGVLLVIPLMADFTRKRDLRGLAYLILPVSAFAGWALYSYYVTGTIAFLSARIFWRSENAILFRRSILAVAEGDIASLTVLFSFAVRYFPQAIAAVASSVFVLLLVYKVWRLDRALFLYSVISILAIFYFGFIPSFGSFPRYLPFLFPVGLPLYIRRVRLLVVAVAFLICLDYLAWVAFLTDGFY